MNPLRVSCWFENKIKNGVIMHTQSSFYYERVENKLMCGRESI